MQTGIVAHSMSISHQHPPSLSLPFTPVLGPSFHSPPSVFLPVKLHQFPLGCRAQFDPDRSLSETMIDRSSFDPVRRDVEPFLQRVSRFVER